MDPGPDQIKYYRNESSFRAEIQPTEHSRPEQCARFMATIKRHPFRSFAVVISLVIVLAVGITCIAVFVPKRKNDDTVFVRDTSECRLVQSLDFL